MKNLRNLMAWVTLMVVLTMGTVSANASGGIILGDRNSDTTCTTDTKTTVGVILTSITGIILGDRTGIILGDRTGIILGDRNVCEQTRDGIILGD